MKTKTVQLNTSPRASKRQSWSSSLSFMQLCFSWTRQMSHYLSSNGRARLQLPLSHPFPSQWDFVEGLYQSWAYSWSQVDRSRCVKCKKPEGNWRLTPNHSPEYSELALKCGHASPAASSPCSKFRCAWMDFFLYASPIAVRRSGQVYMWIGDYFWVMT